MEHFDVFLSYKQTDESGNITPEVDIAEKLYALLTSKGIHTFYSKQTLERLGETQYTTAIDDALEDATVLVAIGSSGENLRSNWVRYEWDSFYAEILGGRKQGQILSFTQNMSVCDLPHKLRQVQNFGNGLNDLEIVCDFIINALKKYTLKCEEKKRQFKIASLMELHTQGFSESDVAVAVTDNDQNLYAEIPPEIAGAAEQWAEHFRRFPDFCAFVVDTDNQIIGNFSFAGLTSEQDRLMSSGELRDCDLDAKTGDNLYARGTHFAYLMNLSVNHFAESSELYQKLWESFTTMLKNAAVKDGIFFSRIYFKAFLPEHEAKVAARGFHFCCEDKLYGKVFVHNMDPNSTLLALDSELAEIYAKANVKKVKTKNTGHTNVEAMSAHMDFWKQIEEVFYHPKYCRLKKYFMGSTDIPRNAAEHKIGLAVAEWLRDILQYSSALLPFLPEEQQETHNQFEKQILNSALIKESLRQYQFTTEGETLSVEIHSDTISVKSITTFAHIWLDIDKLFMDSDLIELKPYFYENSSALPDESNLELCEGLALRILTGMKVSEDQLRYIPEEFVESYYDYKYVICNSAIMKRVFAKYPFIKKELNWD